MLSVERKEEHSNTVRLNFLLTRRSYYPSPEMLQKCYRDAIKRNKNIHFAIDAAMAPTKEILWTRFTVLFIEWDISLVIPTLFHTYESEDTFLRSSLKSLVAHEGDVFLSSCKGNLLLTQISYEEIRAGCAYQSDFPVRILFSYHSLEV